MYDNSDFGKTVSVETSENDEFTRSVHEQAPHLRETPVAQQVEDPQGVLAAAAAETARGEELRPSNAQEFEGERDYDWSTRPGLDHPWGATLAQEERRLAEEQELREQRKRAMWAHEAGVNRAGSSRVQCEREAREQRARMVERGLDDEVSPIRADPRPEFDADVIAECNRDADRLSKARSCAPTRAALSRMLAEHRADGKDALAAVLSVQEQLDGMSGVPRAIESFESWMGNPKYDVRVTVEARVETLYYPHSTSQQQVAILDDGTSKAKLTVWRRALEDAILREGDRVRVTGGLAGWYSGQAQVAVDSKTRISILESGDGPATRRSDGTVFGAKYRKRQNRA
ncbi:hypothetical protein [Halorubellus sp. PRR65]|uniref:hypothetical protein n=2 Tax=Halobacteriales TaxID=2235 RepID=UPI002B257496|nr:hypothetical protein [Halorubellus sp. PRR65]